MNAQILNGKKTHAFFMLTNFKWSKWEQEILQEIADNGFYTNEEGEQSTIHGGFTKNEMYFGI